MADDTLSNEVSTLREQVALLRQVLDEILVELTWANDNARDLPTSSGAISAVRRITSMAIDPAARDFQVNSVPDAVVEQLRDEACSVVSTKAGTQSKLF